MILSYVTHASAARECSHFGRFIKPARRHHMARRRMS